MNGHQFRPVRERRLDLDAGDHLRDAFHDFVARQHMAAGFHDRVHRRADPCLFVHVRRQQRHDLGIVQQQPSLTAPLGDIRRHMDQQTFLLMRSQVHAVLLPAHRLTCAAKAHEGSVMRAGVPDTAD